MKLKILYGAIITHDQTGRPECISEVDIPASDMESARFEAVILDGKPMRDRCIMRSENYSYLLAMPLKEAEELRRVKVKGFTKSKPNEKRRRPAKKADK